MRSSGRLTRGSRSVMRSAKASALAGRNEIGLRIGIAPTVPDPDIAGTQRTAEIPQRAQLIRPAADGPVLLPDVGPPRVSNQAHGRLAGDRPARRSPIQRADHLHG